MLIAFFKVFLMLLVDDHFQSCSSVYNFQEIVVIVVRIDSLSKTHSGLLMPDIFLKPTSTQAQRLLDMYIFKKTIQNIKFNGNVNVVSWSEKKHGVSKWLRLSLDCYP